MRDQHHLYSGTSGYRKRENIQLFNLLTYSKNFYEIQEHAIE